MNKEEMTKIIRVALVTVSRFQSDNYIATKSRTQANNAIRCLKEWNPVNDVELKARNICIDKLNKTDQLVKSTYISGSGVEQIDVRTYVLDALTEFTVEMKNH